MTLKNELFLGKRKYTVLPLSFRNRRERSGIRALFPDFGVGSGGFGYQCAERTFETATRAKNEKEIGSG